MDSFTHPNLCFNPRTRVGCDMEGAENVYTNRRFNPRTYVRCDIEVHSKAGRVVVSIRAPT